MADRKRFLIGVRRGAALPANAEAAIEGLAGGPERRAARKLRSGRRVVELTDEEAARLAQEHPDLVVEEDQDLVLFLPFPGLPPRVPVERGTTLTFAVSDGRSGQPVEAVTIYCVGEALTYRGVTGTDGVAEVQVHEVTLQRVIASPRGGYWSKVLAPPEVKEKARVEVKLAPLALDGGYTWGALALRVDKVASRFTGKGVRVAFIDSGLAAHEDLRAGGGFDALDGQDPGAWNVDEEGHGTHCAGIAAALANEVGITGVAPDAEVYALKVFPGGRVSDLVESVDWCIDHRMDVISMSLGSRAPSALLEQALADAVARGITCVAAAGNDAGEVSYPARYASCISVSAVGLLGSFPEDSGHALRVSQYLSSDGQYFFAAFSNFGERVDVCAPGVGIVSTVPTGYAAWDGTSMACPFVAGLAALVLEAYPELRSGDAAQPEQVRAIVTGSAADLGLPRELQGAGLVNAALALRAARLRRGEAEASLARYRAYLESVVARAQESARALEASLAEVGRG